MSITETHPGKSQEQGSVTLRVPQPEDGHRVHALIARCKPLDENSMYLNLLQCTHFSDTCVVAQMGDDIVGFVSGYIVPGQPDVLFVWQIAVDSKARGLGLGKRLLRALLARRPWEHIRYIHTTITADNDASWGLFKSLAKELDAHTETSPFFTREKHFGGSHDDEHLLVIGPLNERKVNAE